MLSLIFFAFIINLAKSSSIAADEIIDIVKSERDYYLNQTAFRNLHIPARLWTTPMGEVPYLIDETTYKPHEVQQIENALKHMQSQLNNCIRFVKRTNQYEYVIIRDTKRGCSSWSGKQPEPPNVLNLEAPGCLSRGTIIHEVTHAIGFAHEHERYDRHFWMNTAWENVTPGDWCRGVLGTGTFIDTNVQDQPYDYYSVMHYGAYSCTKNGKPTLIPKFPGIDINRIGANDQLSPIDITKIKLAYNCPL